MQHDAIEDRTVRAADVDTVQMNRANDRYAQVLAWCRLFIGGQSPDVTAGSNALLSILFDMNLLFERWLAAELRPIARQAGFSVKEQSPRRYLAYRTDPDRPVFQTRPDISLIDSESRVVVIIDAKWKMLDGTDTKLGISQQDLYQLAAYANLYRLSHVALVYPRQSGLAPEYNLTLPGTQTLSVTIICLDIDQGLTNQKIVFERIWGRMGPCEKDFRECV
jgi:5-methylcytosine-specific restriction enzyme subunit McrC